MLRFGIMSTAKIGRELVVPAIQDAENCVVTAIASRDLTKAREMADRFSVPHAFGSYEEMLASDIDRRRLYSAADLAACRMDDQGGRCRQARALRKADRAQGRRDRRPDRCARPQQGPDHRSLYGDLRAGLAEGPLADRRGRDRQASPCSGRLHLFQPRSRQHAQHSRTRRRRSAGYRRLSRRSARALSPARSRCASRRSPNATRNSAPTSIRACKADFGDFELSFYISTQMAARQVMVFHGTEGYHRGQVALQRRSLGRRKSSNSPTAATRIAASSASRTAASTSCEAEAFARAAKGEKEEVVTLESSKLNQKVIDAIYRASEKDGWEPV